ncbi:hypothetical protein DDB_G0292910 [Dictyostelium discoideum AX4]|uniref:Ubiquitin-like domain-containing protein n=1 Tax=Dictyostelium discoideum TaxID=44689 RepID=Q54CH9_DICDI|nr:hypothetical protein DDB_G0292910 [Dictyostelium discoideum AX4]EAL61004.1 hypothetical protein DDB_G0292910 [Dictyostelium discoideum AX4]|eukprot:XP_629437.1 hypothetical protein DDB_G0292910 [Dictyostelium discoideum AX4]
MKLFVQIVGIQTSTYQVTETDTIEKVKAKIQQKKVLQQINKYGRTLD